MAIRAAEETIRAGALIVDLMDVSDGNLEAAALLADEVATMFNQLTNGLDIRTLAGRTETSVELLEVVSESIRTGRRASSVGVS